MARKAGDLHLAIKYFKMIGDTEQLAECYLDLGAHAEAAKLLVKEGKEEEAIRLYPFVLQKNPDITSLEFGEQELKVIKKHLIQGTADAKLADILIKENDIAEVIYRVAILGQTQRAAQLYLRCSSDIGPQLLSNENLTVAENQLLAKLFLEVSNFECAGIVYERVDEFQISGDAFCKAEQWERAAYCYDRAGNKAAAVEMRCKQPRKKSRGDSQVDHNPFIIDLTGTEAKKDSFATMEATSAMAYVDGNNAGSMAQDEGFEVFCQSRLLIDLSAFEKKNLWEISRVIKFPSGRVILNFDEAVSGIYFMIKGVVECGRDRQNALAPKEILAAPATIGEFGLLTDDESEIQFTAKEELETRFISREVFLDFLNKNGSIAAKVYKNFTKDALRKVAAS